MLIPRLSARPNRMAATVGAHWALRSGRQGGQGGHEHGAKCPGKV